MSRASSQKISVYMDTGSLLVTGSVSSNVLTFTKGDSSTFTLTVNTGSATTVNTGSLLTTASVNLNTITFTKGDSSTFNITVNTGSATDISSLNTFTGSIQTQVNNLAAATGSYLITSSVSSNIITFTKVNGSQYSLTVNTGSGQPGTVTSVSGSGTVSGITLSGTVTTAGGLLLGGALSATTSSITNFNTGVQNIIDSNTLVSSSGQISYTGITNVPAGIVSSSNQIASITGSSLVTSSVSLNTITYTKGDGSQYSLVLNTGSSGVTSVGTSGTVSGITLTGGPITSTGTITLGGTFSTTTSSITNFNTGVQNIIDTNGLFSSSIQVNANTITNFDSNVLSYINTLSVVSGSINYITGSSLVTASATLNVLTFTKGDATTFNVTINTGSGGGGGGITWSTITATTFSASYDNGYIANNNSTRIVFNLPTTNQTKPIRITGKGSAGWQVVVPVSHTLTFAGQVISGSIQSNHYSDSVELLGLGDNQYQVISSIGNITF